MSFDKYKKIKNEIGYQALYVYLYLEQYGNYYWGYTELTKELDMDRSRTIKCVNELYKYGYVKLEGGVWSNSSYTIKVIK